MLLEGEEIWVSFDVCSLFPRTHIKESIVHLRDLLIKNNV